MKENFVIRVVFLATILLSPLLMGMRDEIPEDDNTQSVVISPVIIYATGILKRIEDDNQSIRIFHDPIATLQWPAMDMPFKIDSNVSVSTLKVGDHIRFEFIHEEKQNTIIRISK